jgi:hypothetical protein
VPVDFDGDGLDEVILYSSTSGRYYIFDVRSDGSLRAIRNGTWSKGWQTIISLEFDGDGGQEILFYKEGTDRGRALIYAGSTSAALGTRLQTIAWVNGWSHIVPIDIDGNGDDELILYKETTGSKSIHDVLRDGTQIAMVGGSWSTGWDIILPIEVDGDRGSELLFYNDRTGLADRGRALIYDMNTKTISTRLKTINWVNGWSHIVAVQLPQ